MNNRISKFFLMGAFLIALAFPGYGQSDNSIVGVEEDWEMVLAEPDPIKASPQILTWMSPNASLEGEHFGVDLNNVQRPDFSSGGFQTKAMKGETLIGDRFSENGANFIHAGETIRWTQRMFLLSNQLHFEVTNGTSQSWGSFGGSNTRVSIASSQSTNLNNYSPSCSLEWSGVGYASNRVTYLRLKTVRLYTSDGNVFTIPINVDID